MNIRHYAGYETVEGDDLATTVMSDRLRGIPSSGVKLIAQNATRETSYGNLSKKVDFAHFRKYKITGAGPVFVLTERTNTEIRASQEYIDAKALRIIGGGTHLNYKGDTSSTTYEDTATLSYEGSVNVGTILSVKILIVKTGTAGTASILLRNITNDQDICEITGITNEGKIEKDMGVISNVPSGKAIFELQAKVSDGADKIKIFELHIAH